MKKTPQKYYTVAIQYDISGDRCNPPPHIEDRIVQLVKIMHEIGFAMDVSYGYAEKNIMKIIEEGANNE